MELTTDEHGFVPKMDTDDWLLRLIPRVFLDVLNLLKTYWV